MTTAEISRPKIFSLFDEVAAMARFAFPIVFAQAGFMFMGVVETAMLGKLGPSQMAGVGVARSLFWLVVIFAVGMMAALDIIAAHALGAERRQDLNRILFAGMNFALWLSVLTTPVLLLSSHALNYFDYEPTLLAHAQTYLQIISPGLPFILIFSALQRYWQSLKQTRIIVAIVLIANIINFAGHSVLIFGKFGVPALGVVGAALASTFARGCMCAMLVFYTWRRVRAEDPSYTKRLREIFLLDLSFLKTMLRFGVPAGAHQAFEVSAFSLITFMAAKLIATDAAANQIVLAITALTYTLPLGLANAAAYRVGHFVGRGDHKSARSAGNAGVVLGVIVMSFFASLIFVYADTVLSFFTSDPQVIATAKNVLLFVAIFQLADAVQGCAVGALRGFGNTLYASVAGAIAFYGIAIPLGSFLCFVLKMRLVGLWIGLTLGLLFLAITAIYLWRTTKPVHVILDEKASTSL